MDEPTPGAPLTEKVGDDRLTSWKEIAAYLKRDVTTVQRWEKREAMPVHRHLHDKVGTVYASRAELDAWVRSRKFQQPMGETDASLDPPAEPERATTPAPRVRKGRFVLLAVAIGVALALGIGFWLQSREYFWRNPIAHAKFQTITDFDGEEQAAAISRDGHLAAFLSNHDGQMDVWVTQIGSGQFHNLTQG